LGTRFKKWVENVDRYGEQRFSGCANYRNNSWLNYKQEKSKTTSNGQINLHVKSADAITIIISKGVSIKLYFDTNTGLLIREEIPASELINTYNYSDHRNINGVQEPF
jgi:hypothetical protein